MLITIYNNEAKDSFQTSFKSNLILPKNCELKLTNAFIALAHRITIPADATKRTYKISANDETAVEHDVVIDAGLYSLSALAKEIESKTRVVANTNKLNLEINVDYDSSKGYDQGALSFDIKALSLYANLFQNIHIDTGDYATFVKVEKDSLISDSTAILTFNGGVNYIGVSSILNTAGTPVEISSWAYMIENEEITFHKWLLPNSLGNDHQPPSVPSSLNPYGAMSFQDNGKNENYWVGLTNGGTSMDDMNDNTFTEIVNLDNIPICMLVVKTTNGGFSAGEVIIYENADGNGFDEVGRIKTSVGFSDFDKIGLSMENGIDVVYWYRKNAGSKWNLIPIKHSAQRYTPANGQALNFCYSVYGKNTAGFANASIKNWYGSFADDSAEKLKDYGQFIKWNWNSNEADLGFEDGDYEKKSTGETLADLKFANEDEVLVDGDNDNETYKTAPYINLMIENLPINSYSDVNTDTLENELDNSKCIASIPRYDQNGKFSIGYNLMYNPVEANVIKLHNEHEINISQLRFRLQQADGQIPQDLDQPMSFVLDFNGEK